MIVKSYKSTKNFRLVLKKLNLKNSYVQPPSFTRKYMTRPLRLNILSHTAVEACTLKYFLSSFAKLGNMCSYRISSRTRADSV